MNLYKCNMYIVKQEYVFIYKHIFMYIYEFITYSLLLSRPTMSYSRLCWSFICITVAESPCLEARASEAKKRRKSGAT